jgi:hypothetical protein
MRPFIIFSVLALAACDETAEGVRHDYVDRHSDAFVYTGTTHDYVMTKLRSVMADKGLEVVPTSDPTTFNARPRAAPPSNRNYDGYAIHVVDLRWRTGFTVHIIHQQLAPDGTVTDNMNYRDDRLEWELIQRADPDRAADIMAKANDKADKVAPRKHSKN